MQKTKKKEEINTKHFDPTPPHPHKPKTCKALAYVALNNQTPTNKTKHVKRSAKHHLTAPAQGDRDPGPRHGTGKPEIRTRPRRANNILVKKKNCKKWRADPTYKTRTSIDLNNKNKFEK